jgi:hypothetical protein
MSLESHRSRSFPQHGTCDTTGTLRGETKRSRKSSATWVKNGAREEQDNGESPRHIQHVAWDNDPFRTGVANTVRRALFS